MVEVLKSIVSVFGGALIGFMINVILEHRKKRIEQIHMAKLFVNRIKSQLEFGDDTDRSMGRGLTKETFDLIQDLVIRFERDDIYHELISKMGSFPPMIVDKIVEYFDYLNLYVQDLKKLKGADDIGTWVGFYKLKIMGIECQMYLNKEILKDSDQFNNNKKSLKNEYNRYIKAINTFETEKKNNEVKSLEHELKSIKKIFEDFKIEKELNCT